MISEISVVLNYNYKESGLERRDNMKRILVISDIHGEIEKFEQLLVEAQYDVRQDQLILLGIM